MKESSFSSADDKFGINQASQHSGTSQYHSESVNLGLEIP